VFLHPFYVFEQNMPVQTGKKKQKNFSNKEKKPLSMDLWKEKTMLQSSPTFIKTPFVLDDTARRSSIPILRRCFTMLDIFYCEFKRGLFFIQGLQT
jgi:hypothetical protein